MSVCGLSNKTADFLSECYTLGNLSFRWDCLSKDCRARKLGLWLTYAFHRGREAQFSNQESVDLVPAYVCRTEKMLPQWECQAFHSVGSLLLFVCLYFLSRHLSHIIDADYQV